MDKRIPVRAVVWLFKDQTPDTPKSKTSSPKDGSPAYQFNLSRDGSLWRPQLSMELLSGAFAQELQAWAVESADVVGPSGVGAYPILEEEAGGAKLLVQGTVLEASWLRPRTDSGSYSLEVELSATLVRLNQPDLPGFWAKTVKIDAPHRGRPAQDLAKAVHQAFSEAAEELARELAKSPAAEILPQATQ